MKGRGTGGGVPIPVTPEMKRFTQRTGDSCYVSPNMANRPEEDAVGEFKRKLKALIRPSEVYVGLNLHLLLDTL